MTMKVRKLQCLFALRFSAFCNVINAWQGGDHPKTTNSMIMGKDDQVPNTEITTYAVHITIIKHVML